MRVPAAASTRVCAVTAACVTVPEVGVGASVMWHCVGSAAAGTAACACRLSGATVRRATQGTDARTSSARVGVAWVGPAWVWSGASVEAGSPGPHAPFPCVTRRVPTGELAPAPECVPVPRGTPAAGAPSRSVNTYPSKWNTRGRTRRRCQSGFRRTAGPGAGRRAPPSDRATRPSRRSFTEQCTLVRLPPPRPE